MIEYKQTKLKEEQFISRLRENLLSIGNASGIQETDNLAELRKLTGGKLLRSELETKYPSSKSLSMRITPKAGLFAKEKRSIVLAGKTIVRLKRFVEKGGDDEPISLSELNTILTKESDLASRNCHESVLGLCSPTGWVDDAKAFIANDPPGSGWASNRVHPILIGPDITELVWDKKSGRLNRYIQCFCGLTLTEREQVCKDAIKKTILVQEFANLSKIAVKNGFDMDFVKGVAEKISSEEKNMKLTKVKDVGLVLKRKI